MARIAATIALLTLLPASAMAVPAVPAVPEAQEAEPSADMVLARPDAVHPFAYAPLVQQLWTSGRRTQATFWFYVFQIRTRPWADADVRGDGVGALRAALNDELGTVVNRWVAGDLRAWQAIVTRAIAYEAHLPLNAERPEGISAAAWTAAVAKSRADYAAGARATLFTLTPEGLAAERRKNGLPVGPLEAPGPPLPEAWR